MRSLHILKKGSGTAVFNRDSKREVHDKYSRDHFKKKYEGMEYSWQGGQTPATVGGGGFKLMDRVQDPQAYYRNMKDAKRQYERGCKIKLTPDIKNALWRKARVLKEKIKQGMVSKRDMHPVKQRQIVVNGNVKMSTVVDNERMNRTKAVDRNRVWEKRNHGNLMEFKRVMRLLDPDNPKVTHVVENWRPE